MNYIEVSEKKSCMSCQIAVEARFGTVLCPILKTFVDDYIKERHPNCPIKELRTKKLEWYEATYGSLRSCHDKNFHYHIVPMIRTTNIWLNNEELLIEIPKQDNIMEIAKQYCQAHYDEQFYGMIGGE